MMLLGPWPANHELTEAAGANLCGNQYAAQLMASEIGVAGNKIKTRSG